MTGMTGVVGLMKTATVRTRRAEILIRDSQTKVSFDGCRVVSGLWNLPYSGGSTTSASQIDIDHIIPLKWAHGHGGDRWSSERKKAFANDPDNLLGYFLVGK